jgi:hypothetical protein
MLNRLNYLRIKKGPAKRGLVIKHLLTALSDIIFCEAANRPKPADPMWPAFWMMPTDSVYGGWGQAEKSILWKAAMIWISSAGPFITAANGPYCFRKRCINVTDFCGLRIYSIEWGDHMRWYVDGVLVETSWWTQVGVSCAFNQQFYSLISCGGTHRHFRLHDVTINLPQQMLLTGCEFTRKINRLG